MTVLNRTIVPDTVISGKTYKVFQEPYVINSDIKFKSYFFRQEDEQVYRYYEDAGREMLVYDSSLSVGDIIVKGEQTRLKVVDVGTVGDYPAFVKDEGADRKMPHLRGVDDPSVEDWWIEGIGSVYTGLLDKSDFNADSTFLESMYCKGPRDFIENGDEYACFVYDWDCLKTYAGRGLSVETPEEQTDYYNFLKNDSRFLMEFLDDTLHTNGFINLLHPMFVADARVDGNNVNVEINDISDWGYLEQRYGHPHKIDIKIPGFTQGVHTVYEPRIRNTVNYKNSYIIKCGTWKEGDENGDGEVDISDVVAIINAIAGIDSNGYADVKATSVAKAKADVNGDGKIDISDITAVINIIAGTE